MRKLALLVVFLFSISGANNAHAMENGDSALNHPRIVSVNQNGHGGCTGWLYSSRIVFTNSHCVHVWEKRPEKVLLDPQKISVSKPGTKYDFSWSAKHVPAIQVFTTKTFAWFRAEVGGTLSYADDFAAIVLKEPLVDVETAKLVTPDQLKALVDAKSLVWTGGYGLQGAADREKQNKGISREGLEPKKAQYKIISNEEGMNKVNEYRQKWSRNFFQEIVTFVRVPMNGPSPCDGDSGSGFFLEDGDNYTYLGVTHVNLGNTNCGMDSITSDGVTGFAPVYLFSDIVKSAEEYVAANPVNVATSKTIYCKKGKRVRIISKVNPKCPTGYKKTAKSI